MIACVACEDKPVAPNNPCAVCFRYARRETIVAAAVRIPVSNDYRSMMWRGKRSYPDYLTITAPPPARHGTIMAPLSDYIGKPLPAHDQGFITSTGRYVGREEALKIALSSGQPMIDHPSRNDTWLFSEDLW